MDNFEKNYERTVDKAVNAVEKAGGVANRLQIGCWTIFFNLFFAGFCLWGAYAGYVSWKLDSEGEKTTGKVIRLEESNDSESGCCVYSPVIEFQANGQTFTFEGDNASDPPAYKVGEQVEVIYDPANPDTAQINKWTERWLFPIIIIPVMILAALVMNFFMIRSFVRNDPISE
ncbi:MAG: DUF3592 domain-containing protein [Anaerolineales bacterium]|nr:DUF3592 domain-containing protein [Anaerolineales bacterium]